MTLISIVVANPLAQVEQGEPLLGEQIFRPRVVAQELPDPELGRDLTLPTAPRSIAQTLALDPLQQSVLLRDIDRRDYDAAEELLAAEIEKNPKSPQLLSVLASISFLNGNYLNAAIALKKAEKLAPLNDRERFTLAMAYVALKHPDWARPELEKLALSDKKNAMYPYWLSRLDYNDMSYRSAAANGRRAIELDPNFMRAYDNLGLVYEAIGELDKAIEAYSAALKLNDRKKPCSPWPGMNQGALFIKLGQLNKAEAPLRESIGCDARFPRAHYQLGLWLEKQNQLAGALHELEQATALNPTYPEPHFAEGRIYRKLGDEAKAEKAWAKFQVLKEEKAKAEKLRQQSH